MRVLLRLLLRGTYTLCTGWACRVDVVLCGAPVAVTERRVVNASRVYVALRGSHYPLVARRPRPTDPGFDVRERVKFNHF